MGATGTGAGGVRKATEKSIELDFYYRGVRCRERIKLAPTARNIAYATNLLGTIKIEIEKGTFDYAERFPNSKRARRFSKTPASLDTVSERLTTWLAGVEHQLEHSTFIGYSRIVENILKPRLGTIRMRDFDRSAARELINSFGATVTAKRINNVLGPLRSALEEAVEDGALEANPLKDVRAKRRETADAREEVDPFSPAEVSAILAAIDEPQVRNYCQFNFSTGLRTSEMIALCWSDVDWAKGEVVIRRAWVMGKMKAPKTKSGRRIINLVGPALEALKAQRKHTQLAGEFVFHDPRTGARWGSDQTIRAGAWTRALRAAEVRYRYPYQMRHTFASHALSAGENIMWVAKQMGHRDWTVTAKKYARWIPSIVPDAGSKLTAVWANESAIEKLTG